jgi:hypothetical protein
LTIPFTGVLRPLRLTLLADVQQELERQTITPRT